MRYTKGYPSLWRRVPLCIYFCGKMKLVSTRKITFSIDEFYHLYNRGVEKRTIFLDIDDYQRFLELLFVVNTTKPIDIRLIHKYEDSIFDFDRGNQLVAIGAYCLMPNHFHILLTPLVDDGVSKFMGKLCTSYSMYFNKKYKRTGALFQGMFKAQWANNDEYLKYLYSYIHLNPVKLIDPIWKEKGIKNSEVAFTYASSYQYSSLSDYLGAIRQISGILTPTLFPDYFSTHLNIRKELLEWINFQLPIDQESQTLKSGFKQN